MQSFTAVIKDPIGMHARPTSIVVSEASKYKYDIKIKVNNNEGNLKSIMSVMSLAIKQGDEFTIIANSKDKTAINSIKKLMLDNKLI